LSSAPLDGPPPNAHDRWAASARLVSHSGGLATVELSFRNQALGALPAVRVTITWKPGMEARDVEALALQLAGQSLAYLSRACLDAATAKTA
jgi:hypothetical protein